MKSIREVAAHNLTWNQPKALSHYWELLDGNEPVATLKWAKATGTLATATCADGEWTFKRSGFLHVRVHVRKAGSDQDLAIYYPSWIGNGTLEGPGGSRLQFYSKGFLHAQWGWKTEQNVELLTLKQCGSLLKHMAEVQITPDGASRPDLALLVAFGFYITILMEEDAAAAAGVVGAIG